jgi:hypothetical protein
MCIAISGGRGSTARQSSPIELICFGFCRDMTYGPVSAATAQVIIEDRREELAMIPRTDQGCGKDSRRDTQRSLGAAEGVLVALRRYSLDEAFAEIIRTANATTSARSNSPKHSYRLLRTEMIEVLPPKR